MEDLIENAYCEDNIVRQLAIQEAYETTYGIFDHSRTDVNYAMNTLHPTIQSTRHFHFDNAIRRYLSMGVFQKTGIPLNEFMKQAHWVNEMIYDALVDQEAFAPKVPKIPGLNDNV